MTYIRVKVKPHSLRDHVEVLKDDRIIVSVREKTENNKANDRVHTLLATHFGVRPKQLTLVRGHHTPHKVYRINHASNTP